MKRAGKIAVVVALVLVVFLIAGISLTIGWRPFLGPKTRALTGRTFERTPERLARGKYLVEAVAGCMDCHAPHDWTQHEATVSAGMEGTGQDMSLLQGLPGRVVAPNLTPDAETGVGTWSDDTLARAIREGIGHDGRALFPLMPYPHYRLMSDEDLASIVVYLRSLAPVRNAVPQTQIIFPVKYLIRSVPQPVTAPVPDLADPVKRGAYLTNLAACSDCHTPVDDKGNPLAGLDFAGGQILAGPWGSVASANITPDASGISYYDETLFVGALRTGYVRARKLNQIMPWAFYRNMTDEDLKAIFAYLKTLRPVRHHVDNAEPAALCPICKTIHGGGDRNNGN